MRSMYSTFTVRMNCHCLVFDFRVLGTAGQNVNDVYRVSTFEDRLEILEHTMMWGHIAPTAPDTLGTIFVV